ncbi:hypothetical protein [Actinoplanes couchii]|uniref:hypothetical protein n=1 Tax=Actinoplanes couchii TaxID=403638 RepID=UPI001EF2908F|nr:hypothetical protein [Actinoplanes couchii]MDR6323979.1 DNA-directed RNA polymerase specialized sigma24 family protein [Actinoplanes couchii]
MSDSEAEFREFAAARMEAFRGLAYLTCGDCRLAEDAVLSAMPAKQRAVLVLRSWRGSACSRPRPR